MKIDVLNLEWSSAPSRDRESATLVCNFLRLKGLSVHEGAIFNGFHLIDTLKPDLVFITNSIGATINRDIVRYAKSKRIHCITASSEGNFKEESINQFLWGHNTEQVLYEDLTFLWNKNALDYSLAAFPQLKGRVSICGGIGFDRYKLEETTPLKQSKCLQVLLSCWNFDFLNPSSPAFEKFNGKDLTSENVSFFKADLIKFNSVLKETIINLPNIEFVLKMHPGCQGGLYYSGIEGCQHYPNVKIIQNEVGISELIAQSDLVLSYESTTALEAWLCKKPTALINPSGVDFVMREGFHLGQPNFPTSSLLCEAIKGLSESGELVLFDKFENTRNKLIDEIIGWQDGFNHVRIANAILKQIKMPKTKVKISRNKVSFMASICALKIKWHIYPKIQQLFPKLLPEYKRRTEWNQSQLESFAKIRLKQQEKYYTKKGYSLDELSKVNASEEVINDIR
ncbi:BFO_1060 family glycosyltransferase [Vibrio sp. E150_011]